MQITLLGFALHVLLQLYSLRFSWKFFLLLSLFPLGECLGSANKTTVFLALISPFGNCLFAGKTFSVFFCVWDSCYIVSVGHSSSLQSFSKHSSTRESQSILEVGLLFTCATWMRRIRDLKASSHVNIRSSLLRDCLCLVIIMSSSAGPSTAFTLVSNRNCVIIGAIIRNQ